MNEDGQTSTIRDKILTIDVQPGWKRGTRITFEKEGDQVSTESQNSQLWKGPLEITYFHHNLAVRQVGSVPGRDPGWRWGGARIQGQTRW